MQQSDVTARGGPLQLHTALRPPRPSFLCRPWRVLASTPPIVALKEPVCYRAGRVVFDASGRLIPEEDLVAVGGGKLKRASRVVKRPPAIRHESCSSVLFICHLDCCRLTGDRGCFQVLASQQSMGFASKNLAQPSEVTSRFRKVTAANNRTALLNAQLSTTAVVVFFESHDKQRHPHSRVHSSL